MKFLGALPLPFSDEILHLSCPIPFPLSITKMFIGMVESEEKSERSTEEGARGKTWPLGEREAEYEDQAKRKASCVPAASLFSHVGHSKETHN